MADRTHNLLRSFRIAWTAFFAVLTVLLMVLWVRSYWREDALGYNFEINYGFGVGSSHGRTTFTNYDARGYTGIDRIRTKGFYLKSFRVLWLPGPQCGYGIKGKHEPATYLTVPHWSLVVVSAILATVVSIPLISWRFSLRALLIAITLVAVVFGMLVYGLK